MDRKEIIDMLEEMKNAGASIQQFAIAFKYATSGEEECK